MPAIARRLGWNQATVLRTMQKPGMGVWNPSSAWRVSDHRRVMEALVERGLLEKIGEHTYRITPAGRAWKVY